MSLFTKVADVLHKTVIIGIVGVTIAGALTVLPKQDIDESNYSSTTESNNYAEFIKRKITEAESERDNFRADLVKEEDE